MDTEDVDQLHSRAGTLASRFQKGWERSDIEEAIGLDREALACRPPGHPKRAVSLTELSVRLYDRYCRCGEMKDIEETIVLEREALDLRPPGHPDRSSSLIRLAGRLYTWYNQNGVMQGLEEAIILSRESLHLRPPGHPDWSVPLNDLAACLFARFRHQGTTKDLEEAILLGRKALHLRPHGHPDRPESLSNIASYIFARYRQHGAIGDLEKAIVLGREAPHLWPPCEPNRTWSLAHIAMYLFTRFKQQGAIEDLEEAVVFGREALHLRPPSHPVRSASLNNLALYIFARYDQLGGMQDLEEAIVLNREALGLRPPGHPHRSWSLDNFATHLSARFEQLGGIQDLEEAVALSREVLHLRPPSHPDRSTSLNNLAYHLFTWFRQLGGMQNLEEAIVCGREALGLRPPGHPDRSMSLNNLSKYLLTRYKQHRATQDLDEAIVLGRESLHFVPPGHPLRSSLLDNLASCLSDQCRQSEELGNMEEVFDLYAQLADVIHFVSPADLSAAKSWINLAEHFQHSTLILAYETSLRLVVQHLAILPSLPQHLVILKNLTSSLAVDAFSACLRHRSPKKAIELLEQGRGVFWRQLARLHSPLDDVLVSGPAGKALADEFARIASLIRSALDSTMPNQHEQVYRLNAELQKVMTRIRELHGLSRFLIPSLFSDLQRAASGGPIIIVNSSKHGCDALVIFLNRDPVHIPLLITQARVRDLSKELRTLTICAKRADVTKELALFLRKLWDEIISPIVDFLQTTLPTQSRIWWCPTAEFSLLPLHAAAPCRKGQRKLADIYISSYTPTLTALIQARRPNPSDSPDVGKGFAAIGQARAIGEGELPSVGAELENIGKLVDGLIAFARIDGEESCVTRVAEELGRNEWVHLACHGIPNPTRPFESAFALRDGRFTIQQIIGCELKDPEFVYLSACHTTVGDEESPDEVIHLAAAMQFAGFRSVIGTMWAVDDGETNKITSMFYRHMVDESGCLKHTRAAYALNRTMRSVNVSLDQRILYIHIGA